MHQGEVDQRSAGAVALAAAQEDAHRSLQRRPRGVETALVPFQGGPAVEHDRPFDGVAGAFPETLLGRREGFRGALQIRRQPPRVAEVGPGAGSQIFHQLRPVQAAAQEIGETQRESRELLRPEGVLDARLLRPVDQELQEAPGVVALLAQQRFALSRLCRRQLADPLDRRVPLAGQSGGLAAQTAGRRVESLGIVQGGVARAGGPGTRQMEKTFAAGSALDQMLDQGLSIAPGRQKQLFQSLFTRVDLQR
jgi:hypothetical protein